MLVAGVADALADTGRFAPGNPWFQHFEAECRVIETVAEDCRGSILGAFKETSQADNVSCDFEEFWRARDKHVGRILPVLPWQYGVEILVAEPGVCRVNPANEGSTAETEASPGAANDSAPRNAAVGDNSDDGSGQPSAIAPYEFLLTRDQVISLTTAGARLSLGDTFDKPSLETALTYYELEFQEDVEGSTQFVVSRNGRHYLAVRGDLQSGEIVAIWATDGVIDAAGASQGMALTEVYRSVTARCSSGLVYGCESEASSSISYDVEWDEKCQVQFHDWTLDGRETTLVDCMKISGFELRNPR